MDTKKAIKTYALSAVAFTVLITVMRTLCLFNSYDAAIGYFNTSPLNTATNILTFLAVIGCVSAMLVFSRGSITTEFTPNRLVFKLASAYSALITIPAVVSIALSAPSGLLEKLALVAAVISTLFFIFSIIKKEELEIYKAFISIVCIALYVCILASLYFNMTVAMNSPHKIYGSFALMSAMLLMLCEVRIYLGKPAPRAHLVLSMLTLLFGFSQSVSSLIYRISESSEFATSPVVLGNAGYVILLAAISVYAAARCFSFRTSEASESPKVTEEEGNGV